MNLGERIAADLKSAMKDGRKERTAVLRMVRARIQEAEVRRRGEKGRDYALTDDEVTAAIAAYAKQRRDSIQSYRECGREDLAAREEAELAILEEYLPARLDAAAIRQVVAAAIAESGASSPKDLGRVMKLAMPKLQGAADGKEVNRIARELLAGS